MARRSSLDKGSVTAGLTNTAYNDVKVIADNLDELLLLAANLNTLSSFSVQVVAGVGDGTLAGDMNATNWTGNAHADSSIVTALKVLTTETLIINHGGNIYYYIGAVPALLGVGGSAVTAGNFSILGNGDHDALTGKTAADQHSIAAITGLQTDLTSKQTDIDDSLKLPAGDPASPVLANVLTRALKFLGFDAAGNIIYSTGTTSVSANAVPIDDVANYYTAIEVEAALAELGATTGAGIIQAADAGSYFVGTTLESIIQEIGANYAKKVSPTLTNAVLDGTLTGTALAGLAKLTLLDSAVLLGSTTSTADVDWTAISHADLVTNEATHAIIRVLTEVTSGTTAAQLVGTSVYLDPGPNAPAAPGGDLVSKVKMYVDSGGGRDAQTNVSEVTIKLNASYGAEYRTAGFGGKVSSLVSFSLVGYYVP